MGTNLEGGGHNVFKYFLPVVALSAWRGQKNSQADVAPKYEDNVSRMQTHQLSFTPSDPLSINLYSSQCTIQILLTSACQVNTYITLSHKIPYAMAF